MYTGLNFNHVAGIPLFKLNIFYFELVFHVFFFFISSLFMVEHKESIVSQHRF